MTSSLLLAQQSANEVLEELEDEYEAEASTDEDHLPLDEQGDPLSPFAMGRDPVIRRRRNRSRFDNNMPWDRGSLGRSAAGARTSVLLNAHLRGDGELALGSRATIASVIDKRLSIEQSNHLLQRWTDQMDPLAEDVAEGTQTLDDHENLSRYPENAIGSSPSISAMLDGSWTGSRSAAISEFPLVRPLFTRLTLEETTELFRKTLEEARQNTVDGLPDNEEAAFRPKLTLDLGHSKIPRVPENVVDLIKSEVERLSLSHNQIWHIPLRFAECSQLRYLNIRTCMFREIPRSVYKLPLLEILDISRNKVRIVSREVKNLTSLRVFSIVHNRLEDLPFELSEMTKLQILKVQENPLRYKLKRVIEAKEAELGPLNLATNKNEIAITAEVKRFLRERTLPAALPMSES
jgi:hypothetical protein